mmetsp:Transcript_47441/g.125579  ORF Transcript_47441/g.125579 Transcript_47441/m.125579 type:complete len:341 (-) Transcript_47441:74-1096(-)
MPSDTTAYGAPATPDSDAGSDLETATMDSSMFPSVSDMTDPGIFDEVAVVNTFLQVKGERACARRFYSAPPGMHEDLLAAMIREADAPARTTVVCGPTKRTVPTPSPEPTSAAPQQAGSRPPSRLRRESWADMHDDHATTDTGFIVKAEQMIIDHLRAEPCASMNVSTMGNRLPKSLIHALKIDRVRVVDLINSLQGVTVADGVVYLVAPAEQREKGRTFRRGEFLQTMRHGLLQRSEARQVLAVVASVADLLSESEDQQQSTFALGNWLAPGCRSFLKMSGVRLLEILREFPEHFNCCCGTASKPIVALVRQDGICEQMVYDRLCCEGRSCERVVRKLE